MGFCLHGNASLCPVMTVIVPLLAVASTSHSAHNPDDGKARRLLDLVMRIRIELVPDSTVYTMLDWFHATFRAFSFDRAKTARIVSDWFVLV